MKPRLVRISDSAAPEVLLDSVDVTIGRDGSNSVRVEDAMASSRHCRIEREGDRFVLVDRESTNGTFVNGKAITHAYLQHGDEIQIGRSKFQFFVGEASDSSAQVQVEEVEDNLLLSRQTVRLNPMNSAYLKGVGVSHALPVQRATHDIGVLLRLSAEINEIDDSETLQRVLLERIFEIAPAENGLILLGSDAQTLLLATPVVRQAAAAKGPSRVSRTILQQVFTSSESLLRNDLLADEATSESIVASRIHSALCVPLIMTGTPIGVIYLTTGNPGTPFDERHMELVTAIAGIAVLVLEHVRYVEWLERENRQLSHEVNLQHDMVGESPKMKHVYEAISRVAPTDSPVLILGESGTGKELAARAIHNNSDRRKGPLVVVNCGAIAETLFLSELFGHVKGAFTGAERDRKGLIEEAGGGTLFLDELGELPLHCQAALLRVLENREILRVGSSRPIAVDIRLISATNRSLKEQISGGGFRADLYYRMGLPLELPALRERLDDIPLLSAFFLQKFKHYTSREIGAMLPDTIRVLQEYHWPGNVRELAGAIQWAVVFGKSDRIRPEDLPANISRGDRAAAPISRLDDAMESFERQFILRALEETRGNVVEAAALLARAPNYLQRRISSLKLRGELDRMRSQADRR